MAGMFPLVTEDTAQFRDSLRDCPHGMYTIDNFT